MTKSILFQKCLLVFLTTLLISCNGVYYYPGFDFDNFKGTANEELAYAVEDDNSEEIKRLVNEKKLDVDFQEKAYGMSLLMLAVVNKKINSVKTLLELGANPNLVSNDDKNVVLICCQFTSKEDCNSEILELLLQYGGAPNHIAHMPQPENTFVLKSPINECVLSECIENIDLLLKYGGDINLYTEHEGYGAITESILNDKLDITKYLIIEKKAKIPEYCWITFSDQPDSLSVIEFLNSQDYDPKSDQENFLLREEIIEYIENNVDSLGNHKDTRK